MASRMPRLRNPLGVAWWPDHLVVCHRISTGVVEKVGPFVNVFGPRLDGLAPAAVLPCVQRAAGSQHTQRFGHRDAAEILGHYQVHQVFRVRQMLPVEAVDRDRAVQSKRSDILACLADVLHILIQPVNQIAVTAERRPADCAQRGCELSVATTNMDD